MIIWVFAIVLLAVLAALSFIDFKTMILPDKLTLPLLALGLGFAYWQGDFLRGLIGAVIGYAGLVTLELGYKKIRGHDGLGRGDAKLLAAGGAWCGWTGLPFILLIASASGLLHALILNGREQQAGAQMHIPFGPHLALGIFSAWMALFILT